VGANIASAMTREKGRGPKHCVADDKREAAWVQNLHQGSRERRSDCTNVHLQDEGEYDVAILVVGVERERGGVYS
jgi:hypothetical protein